MRRPPKRPPTAAGNPLGVILVVASCATAALALFTWLQWSKPVPKSDAQSGFSPDMMLSPGGAKPAVPGN